MLRTPLGMKTTISEGGTQAEARAEQGGGEQEWEERLGVPRRPWESQDLGGRGRKIAR